MPPLSHILRVSESCWAVEQLASLAESLAILLAIALVDLLAALAVARQDQPRDQPVVEPGYSYTTQSDLEKPEVDLTPVNESRFDRESPVASVFAAPAAG